MKEKLNQFIDNLNGQFIEVSSREAIYQCMDLAYTWVFALGFPKATIQNQHAHQVFTNPKAITKEYFDIIPKSPTFVPQDGDIGVFNKTSSNVAGHIGICLSGGNTQNFPFFEQNSPLGTHAHVKPHKSYSNFLGVLRPKGGVQTVPTLEITNQTRIPQIDNKEVQAIKSELNDLVRDNKNLKLEASDALNKLTKCQSALDSALEKIGTLEHATEPENDTTVSEVGFFTRLGSLLDALVKRDR